MQAPAAAATHNQDAQQLHQHLKQRVCGHLVAADLALVSTAYATPTLPRVFASVTLCACIHKPKARSFLPSRAPRPNPWVQQRTRAHSICLWPGDTHTFGSTLALLLLAQEPRLPAGSHSQATQPPDWLPDGGGMLVAAYATATARVDPTQQFCQPQYLAQTDTAAPAHIAGPLQPEPEEHTRHHKDSISDPTPNSSAGKGLQPR